MPRKDFELQPIIDLLRRAERRSLDRDDRAGDAHAGSDRFHFQRQLARARDRLFHEEHWTVRSETGHDVLRTLVDEVPTQVREDYQRYAVHANSC